MKALSYDGTTSSYGFNSKYQIKVQLEQQNSLAAFEGVFDHVQIDSYDIDTQAGVKEFIDGLMTFLHEYQQGYHAKHQIAKLYLSSRDGWSNEAREVNKQIVERLDISKGYLSKVQSIMDFRAKIEPKGEEFLAYFDGHPVTVQYYMTRLSPQQIWDYGMAWGHQFTRQFFEAEVSPGNSGKPKQLTEKQQQNQDLLEKYQDKRYLGNPKAAAVYDSKPSNGAVLAAAMQILADQHYRNSDWISSVRELQQLTTKYLNLPFYRQ